MLLYGAAMLLSAFLLFLIQPLIGKFILPWFGGTPGVWTTCMLFFQAWLLGGYGYAHALSGRCTPRRQGWVHVSLVLATILVVLWFSIVPSPAWKPIGGQSPILGIMGLLIACIGAPYLLLSSTAPLLQAWFSRTYRGASPYRLYALSNLGSLMAILSYPFLIEPSLKLGRQAFLWSWIYVVFAFMCIFLALKFMATRSPMDGHDPASIMEPCCDVPRPGSGSYLLWLGLTACSSIMLLATTAMMCQDAAVVPLLWILPLALYLLSFVLCFRFERLYWRPVFLGGLGAAIAWTCYVMFGGVYVALPTQILSYSLTLFALCMVCHGELVRSKPRPRHLTSFYLTVAAGGALGGLLATVAAPYLLKNFWEYHFGLVATVLLTLIVLFRERQGLLFQGRPPAVWALWSVCWASWIILATLLLDHIWRSWKTYTALSAVVLLTVALLLRDRRGKLYRGRPVRVWAVWALLCLSWIALGSVLGRHIRLSLEDSVAMRRNFFGVLRVLELNKDDPGEHRLTLMHGRIEHGFQFQDKEKRHWPTSYYGNNSGVGLAIRLHPNRLAGRGLRIGVIGLGTGTLAAQGRLGDVVRFYEINPEVLRISDNYFTFVKDSPARIEVMVGDARISMERERQLGDAQRFDVLAVDAFSSDAIPVHLLTRECFEIYRYHLKDDGILAVHISNRYFELSPVVRNLIPPIPGQAMQALWISAHGVQSEGTDSTDWVLLTSNRVFLALPDIQQACTRWTDPAPPSKLWTDDYSNLFNLLRER